jgi:AraC-like DNA-binding protein
MARLTLDWIQVAAVVGTVQGLLLTGVLLTQRNNRTANRLLAALMATFTLFLASDVYYATGLIRVYPHFFGLSYPMPWVFGPLVYLYAVAASDRSWRFHPRHLVHFAPALVVVVASLPFYLASGAEKIAQYDRFLAGNPPPLIAVLAPTKFISGIAYTAATLWYLRRHRRRIENSYSNTARVNLRWLRWLVSGAGAIWALATTLLFTDVGQRLRDDHVALAIAIMVYAIGYLGLRQPEVFRFETAEFAVPEPKNVTLAPRAVETTPEPVARYERSGLSDREAEALKAQLLTVMESDRPWKDSELTLADLAARIGSTPHKLSEVLNGQVGQTFHDFVNGYRVREVQRRIEAGEARKLKMLALAMDAGFASKSTFNEVFKKHTSRTPSDFRQAVGG